MSRISELIKEKCPNGVEYKKIEDLVDYVQPTKYIVNSTDYDDNYKTPVLTAGQTFILGYTNETEGIYLANKENSVIIFDDFTTSNHWIDFNFKVKSSALKILIPKTKDIFKYVYYCISNINYCPKEHSRQWIQTYSKFLIPVPPIEVQEEIVRILDKFGKLEAELEAELEARKQQYEFWREKLFKSNNIKNIENVCLNISSGGTPNTSRTEYYNGNIPWLRTQEVNWNIIYDTELKITQEAIKNSSAKVIPKNCVIVAMYGATVGRVAINDISLSTNQACCNLEINPQIANYKYVFYWLLSQYKHIKSLGQGSQTNINAKTVRTLKIPVPSLEEQRRIVKILDKFNKLVNDISEGLPAEIELRRKQYEYYRNKLLSFEELINE